MALIGVVAREVMINVVKHGTYFVRRAYRTP